MTHTPECLDYQAKLKAARAEWIAKYPDYCRRCEGAGELHDPGNRDEPPSVDDCECLASLRCPRCGSHIEPGDFDGYTIFARCPSCDWGEGGAATDPDHQCLPAFDGCACGEAEEARRTMVQLDAFYALPDPDAELDDAIEFYLDNQDDLEGDDPCLPPAA